MVFSWWMSCVTVNRLTCVSAHTQFNLFSGRLYQLLFDPPWWWCLEVTPLFAYFAKMGKKLVTTQEVLKKSFPHEWRNYIPPSISPRWNIIWLRHKKRLPFFVWLSTRQQQWMHGMGEIWRRLTRVVLIVARSQWNQWSTCPSTAHLLNKCVGLLLTFCGKFLPKEVTLAPRNPFQWCNASLINLCARHSNVLVAVGSSKECSHVD